MQSVSVQAPTAERCFERTTYDWPIFDFPDLFPSLKPNKNGDGAIWNNRIGQRECGLEEVVSDEFMCGQLVRRTSTWQLALRRNGGNLSLGLYCLRCFHEEVDGIWVRFDADILDLNGTTLYSGGGASYFSPDNFTKFTPRNKIENKRNARRNNQNHYFVTDVIPIDTLSNGWTQYVPRNMMNIRLKLCVYHDKPSSSTEFGHVTGFPMPDKLIYSSMFTAIKKSNDFLQSLESLWESMEGADVTISIDGNLLQAHKFVLAAQSPVLKELIAAQERSDSGKECITIEVPLSGQFLNAFKVLLKYFYVQDAGELNDSTDTELISRVLETCKQFGVQSFARICLSRLVANMRLENFGETVVAIFKNVTQEQSFFKFEAKKFLMENQSALQASEEFKRYSKAHPDYFVQICFQPIQINPKDSEDSID